MRSIDMGEYNLCIKDDDYRSLNMAIMPSDFHANISRYYEQSKDSRVMVPYEQFYYCIKFVLIKPENSLNNEFIACFYDKITVKSVEIIKGGKKVLIKMTAFRPKDIFRLDA